MLKLIVLFSLVALSQQAPIGSEIGDNIGPALELITLPWRPFIALAEFIQWIMPTQEDMQVTNDFISQKRNEFENLVKDARSQVRKLVNDALKRNNPEAVSEAQDAAAVLEDTVQLLAEEQEKFADSNGQTGTSFSVST